MIERTKCVAYSNGLKNRRQQAVVHNIQSKKKKEISLSLLVIFAKRFCNIRKPHLRPWRSVNARNDLMFFCLLFFRPKLNPFFWFQILGLRFVFFSSRRTTALCRQLRSHFWWRNCFLRRNGKALSIPRSLPAGAAVPLAKSLRPARVSSRGLRMSSRSWWLASRVGQRSAPGESRTAQNLRFLRETVDERLYVCQFILLSKF